MFRGEPLALWTMILGFISFILVQILGLVISGVLKLDFQLPTQGHFYLAYFGWIGLTILGAQLQFFRAITGLRKYQPQILRYFYHVFLVGGLFLMVEGSAISNSDMVGYGIGLYLIGVLIHTYWIVRQSGSKYFKFPLDYMFISNLFLIISLLSLFFSQLTNDYYLLSDGFIRHILSIGWISLTLQGAMVRILPMFLGKNIDRHSRPFLRHHFIFSSLSATIFIVSFATKIQMVIILSSILWMISWIWVFVILKRSIIRKNLEYKQTLLFFAPGLVWFSLGSLLGILVLVKGQLVGQTNIRALHIHLSLLLGITLIMLGALHRITTFQIYTLLYTGRREKAVTLRSMLKLNRITLVAIMFNLSVIYMAIGFIDNDFRQVGYGGIFILLTTIIYSTVILQNLIQYLKYKKSAIPFWLKSSETEVKE